MSTTIQTPAAHIQDLNHKSGAIANAALSLLSAPATSITTDNGEETTSFVFSRVNAYQPGKQHAAPHTDSTSYTAIPQNVTAAAHRQPALPQNTTPDLMPPSAPRPLPSLLRYVDHELMKSSAVHNQPPHPLSTCAVCWNGCNHPWKTVSPWTNTGVDITSTFLPLTCGHWVHYRCFIWLTTQVFDTKDRCCTCDTQLFEWEGITTLTLATRTGLEMQDENEGGRMQIISNVFKSSDKVEYESECAFIEITLKTQIHAHVCEPAKFADGSPDLVSCYYDVLSQLGKMKKPQARWLQYSTSIGYLLYVMLVAIKMRRYLEDLNVHIEGTEGWREFDEGVRALQERILAEVHSP